MNTQKDRILEYMKLGFSITPLEALSRFGCFRLSSIIYDLKAEKHRIHTELIQCGKKRFAQYRLLKDGELL